MAKANRNLYPHKILGKEYIDFPVVFKSLSKDFIEDERSLCAIMDGLCKSFFKIAGRRLNIKGDVVGAYNETDEVFTVIMHIMRKDAEILSKFKIDEIKIIEE